MGRAKIRMELIKKEKSRLTTLKSRKTGLKKKIQELSTLCDVKVCMIMYEPGNDVKPEIWPADQPNAIQELYNSYTAQPYEDRSKRTADLLSFFKDRNEKLEITLMRQRMKNAEAKYPTWDQSYDNLSEEQLREFASILQTKIEAAKPRLQLPNNYRTLESASSSGVNAYSDCYSPRFLLGTSSSSNEFMKSFYPQPQPISEVKMEGIIDQTGEEGTLNTNYARTLLMSNGDYCAQLDGLYGNLMYSPMEMPLNGSMYSDNMPSLLDYMMANNPNDAGLNCSYHPLTMQQYQQQPIPQYDQCLKIEGDGYYEGFFTS